MTLTMRYAARSDVGLRREGNEDSLYAGPRLLAIADGMGGHAAGEVASAVAIAALAPLDEDAPGADVLDTLRRAVDAANVHLRDMVAGDSALEGMGTTLTALLSSGARLGLAHVGDSRAYLLRDGELSQITNDHTLVQALVDEGRISAEEADHHPQRSVILRVLDAGAVELDLSVREARAGDRYLICSDGLTDVVSEATIRDGLLLPDRQEAVDRLVDLALRGGGPDNISCIVADVVDADAALDGPVLVAGAAAAQEQVSDPSADSAAGRAALATRPRGRRRSGRPAAATGSETTRRRRILLPALLALLVVVLAGAAVLYIRSQYYVGAAGGEVAIYQGLSGSVAGVHLSGVHERLGVRVGDLPPFMQQRVDQGIPASGLGDAREIGTRLRRQSTADCTTTPVAVTPVPSPLASPSPPASAAPPTLSPAPTTPPTCPEVRP